MPLEANMFFYPLPLGPYPGVSVFLYRPLCRVTASIFMALSAPNGSTIEQRLNDQMLHPNFPVPLQIMGGDLKFCDIEIGEAVTIGDITIENALLNHPGEAVGYRVTWQDKVTAYITDTEHFPDRLDENVVWLARDADVMIYDATYTDKEYYDPKSSKVGWGHSTWQEAVKVAKAANAKTLVDFPSRSCPR